MARVGRGKGVGAASFTQKVEIWTKPKTNFPLVSPGQARPGQASIVLVDDIDPLSLVVTNTLHCLCGALFIIRASSAPSLYTDGQNVMILWCTERQSEVETAELPFSAHILDCNNCIC